MTATTLLARQIVVRGVVQGVGFRPHVAQLAAELGLAGRCHNDAESVVIFVEGAAQQVAEFELRVVQQAPPLAQIASLVASDAAPRRLTEFAISSSQTRGSDRTMVPPDTAPCAACLTELHDPGNRRYRHPFITCTHCGPRLTITLDLPYDRANTTLAEFPLCPACAVEYADPHDRRFHAQPIGCHGCGPRLNALDNKGALLASATEAVLAAAITALRRGKIVAIKGLGGYHLACDASNDDAVARLRQRKNRPHQPFAVMARDLTVAHQLVQIGAAEELLAGPVRPIVLLPQVAAMVSNLVAPGLGELGVVLPYTPLHELLFASQPDGSVGAPQCLVMTSGNVSGEPLCYTEADALERLADIADLFLTHNRQIAVPVEDSVVAWSAETGAVPIRRSRGFAPLPIDLTAQAGARVVLAAGAELKNTVAVARSGHVYVSAHVGDLAALSSREAHQAVTDQLLRFHRAKPDLLVADRHPSYASRAWAARQAAEHQVPFVEVQHHHAHLAALAAEHGRLAEPILGLVFDGTGYGCDSTIWGGELLQLTEGGANFQRLGHLGAVRLPGGDAAVRNPVRVAALAVLDAGLNLDDTPLADELNQVERDFLQRGQATGAGVVTTSSVGRLFDVAAALLGVCSRVTYEAQAAIELEAAAHSWWQAQPDPEPTLLPTQLRSHHGCWQLEPGPFVTGLLSRLAAGESAAQLAAAFHASLARGAVELALRAVSETGITVIGLTGGVFVNRLLLAETSRLLRAAGVDVLTHQQVPANDGGLALGQAAVGHVAVGWANQEQNEADK